MRKIKQLVSITLVFTMLSVCLAGCGNDNNSTSGNNTADNAGDDVGNAVEDVADGVGNAIEDVGDAVSGGFDNYSDAHDYFLDQMGNDNTDAQYEVRNESQDLMEYQSGSKGYRFELYDTSNDENGERVGEYYVDAESGLVYMRDEESGNIIQYTGTSGSIGSGGANGNSNGSNGSGEGSTNGNSTGTNSGNTTNNTGITQ